MSILDVLVLMFNCLALSVVKHFMGFEQMVLIGLGIIMFRIYKVQSYCETPTSEEDTTPEEKQ